MHCFRRGIDIVHQHRLGDFEFKCCRVNSRLANRSADGVDQRRIAELARREVDAHRQRCLVFVGQRAGGVASGLDDPVADVDDNSGVLCDLYELARQQQPSFRVLPANQSLDADGALVGQLHLRLVVEFELIFFQSRASLVFGSEPVFGIGIHALAVELKIIAALLFCAVHGEVGVLHQRVGLNAIGWNHRDADTRSDDQFLTVDGQRFTHCGQNLVRHLAGVGRRLHVVEQYRELVAAGPSYRVFLAHAMSKAVGNIA